MQLNPNQTYQAVWQADAQNDPATYYPQAVIRFSNNGNIWKTIDLVSKGNQRYVAPWTTPNVGPDGAQVDMTISVYEDASHTVLSSVYATVNVQYLIQLIASPSIGFGGGGGNGLTLEQVEAVIRRVVGGVPIPKELDIEEFGNKTISGLEPHMNNFQKSIGALNSKYDSFGSAINKQISDNHRDLKFYVDNSLSKSSREQRDSLAEHTTKELSFMSREFSVSISRLRKEIADNYKEIEGNFLKKIEELGRKLEKEYKNNAEKAYTDRHKEWKEMMKEKFMSVLEDNAPALVIKDDTPDYIKKAKKLLGD